MNTPRLDPEFDSSPALNEHWRQQLPAIRRALIQEHRHIVISSGSQQTLDDAGMALVRDLLQTPGVKVLSQQPESTEVLLQRFNQLLADTPIDNALERNPDKAQTLHVFVVHDGPLLQPSDYALMARLVSDLPGAHMRLVVIVDPTLSVNERVQAVGRKALHWSVGPSKRSPPSWAATSSTSHPKQQTPVSTSIHRETRDDFSTASTKSAPKTLWLGLTLAALMSTGVATWLWLIDQPPQSLLNQPVASEPADHRPTEPGLQGIGTARVTGSISSSNVPTGPQETPP